MISNADELLRLSLAEWRTPSHEFSPPSDAAGHSILPLQSLLIPQCIGGLSFLVAA